MSIGSIRQGELSAQQGDGGVYSERLKAFQQNYVRPEFTDIAKEYNDVINADKIKAEKFSQAALNSKVAPSTSKMYESHFQIAKDKFDILYDDETLNHFSKDEAGMRKWSELVDQLNRDIEMYEQIYEDSYGDPSKATGDGITFSDDIARRRLSGGDPNSYWKQKGYEEVSGNDPIEIMKRIDQPMHNNLKLDLENISWDYDSDSRDFLEPNDPSLASTLFSYQLAPASFNSVDTYATNKAFQNAFVSGPEGLDSLINRMHNDDEYVRSAINDYIEDNEIEDANAYDFLQGTAPMMYPSIDEIVLSFDEKVRDATRKFRSSSKPPKATKPKVDKLAPIINSSSSLSNVSYFDADGMPASDGVDFKLFKFDTSFKVIDGSDEVSVQRIGFDDNDDMYAYYKRPVTSSQSDTGDSSDEDTDMAINLGDVDDADAIAGYYKVGENTNLYNQIKSEINKKYGEGSFFKIKNSL